jgi:hypothetical protein
MTKSLRTLIAHWVDRERISQLFLVLVICAASYFLAVTGAYLSQYYLERGPEFTPLATIQDGFFRWDSQYYFEIAADGYSYDGDVCNTQNIVFLPVFPLITRSVSQISGLSVRQAGFLVSRLSFVLAAIILFNLVCSVYGKTAALFVLLGLNFSPGSFAFHSYYSESTMLLFLALALYFHHHRRPLLLSLACGALGASRITVAPFCILFAGLFLWKIISALRDRRPGTGFPFLQTGRDAAYAMICVSGMAGYLLYIQFQFGNPFELLPAIKHCAWSKAHQPMSLFELGSFGPLWVNLVEAIKRPYFFVLDVKTTNLIWSLLAFSAAVFCAFKRNWSVLGFGFIGYFLLTFYVNGKAELMESSYRHYAAVIPIYLMLHALYRGLRARLPELLVNGLFLALFSINVMYMVLYMALFTSGMYHFF